MNLDKTINISSIANVQEDRSLILTINLANSILEQWCLCLCLLYHGLTDTVQVTDNQTLLNIQLGKNVKTSMRGLVFRQRNGYLITITKQELEYWLSFFLKYWRDGVAEVDHIDVELIPDKTVSTDEFDLILRVDKFAPPVSPTELYRRLSKL